MKEDTKETQQKQTAEVHSPSQVSYLLEALIY